MNHLSQRKRPGGEQTERLEARVSAELKGLFQRAADLEGVTLSDFMISTLVERSRATIREHEIIVLTGQNRAVFLAALQNPPEISPKLAATFSRLKDLQNAGAERSGKRAGAVADKASSRPLRKRK